MLHYHQVNVQQVQQELLASPFDEQLNQLLALPLLTKPDSLSVDAIQKELDNNIQGLLGYVVRWLEHGVIDESQIIEALQRMTKIVDGQNAADELYRPMSADFDTNIAFNAAKYLIFKGKIQPSGYAEPLLHKSRIKVKQG